MGTCLRCGRDNGKEQRQDASLCSLCIDRWCQEIDELTRGGGR